MCVCVIFIYIYIVLICSSGGNWWWTIKILGAPCSDKHGSVLLVVGCIVANVLGTCGWPQPDVLAARWSQVVTGGHRWSQVVTGGHRWSHVRSVAGDFQQRVGCFICKNRSNTPSGKQTKSYWKWPFIVDLPIDNGDFSIVMLISLPEGMYPLPLDSSWHILAIKIALTQHGPLNPNKKNMSHEDL